MSRPTPAVTVPASPTLPALIETKLRPARPRPGTLVRRRLLLRLDEGAAMPLTLLDAPVGFGKTLLLESWCARHDGAVAWVSLETGDNDTSRLWSYVATAVDRVRQGLGRSALRLLGSPGSPPESVVDELLNGLHAYRAPLAIVLDDTHLIADEACWRTLERLVTQLPHGVRVILATRSDPPLPLGRLRVRGALEEIHARDLAFTFEEARELLVGREGIALRDAEVEVLLDRTEGWPAGLYLAALWLRDLDDPAAGVQDFQGSHRHVVDYLTGEVLDALDAETRLFLCQTSTLGVFDAPLCDGALGRTDSAARLARLERENGFLIGLDASRRWYRYHHLFGELLQLELANLDANAPARLHASASAYCWEHGRFVNALEHAAAAGDPGLVAAILSAEHRTLLRSARLTTILRWCDWLPEDELLERPEIPVAAALAAGLGGLSALVRYRYLAIAERSRAELPDRWTSYHEVALALARITWIDGDLAHAVASARAALDVARGAPEVAVPFLASLGMTLFLVGEVEEARALSREALERPEAHARPHGLVAALSTRALIAAESGDASAAERDAGQALAAAKSAGILQTAVGGAARVAHAVALVAGGRLAEAEAEAVEGERLRRCPEPEAVHVHALLVLADVRTRRRRLGPAAAALRIARTGLAAFTDAGRLPLLADEVGRRLDEAVAETATIVVEPPSQAELNVLRLLATDLSQREIGGRLYVSLNTVKTHTRALYRKLGVASREAAVERATALGLLGADESPG